MTAEAPRARAGGRAADAPLPRRRRPRWVRRLRRLRRQGRDAVLAGLMLLAAALLALVPLGWAVAAGGALGGALGPRLGPPWRWALAHLALAFPGWTRAEHERVARAAFANAGRSLIEMLKMPALRRRMAAYVRHEGFEHLDRALTEGRGVLCVTGHVGNWELLAASVGQRGYPLDVIGRRMHSPLLNRLLLAFRARSGVTTILRESRGAARGILAALRRNRLLAMLIDQDTRGPHVFVPFFGTRAATPSGAAALARRSGAPVLPVFIARRPEGGHVVRMHPPVPRGAADTDESLTAAFTRAIEADIRRHPEEWVWWHRRWRRCPPDAVGAPGAKP